MSPRPGVQGEIYRVKGQRAGTWEHPQGRFPGGFGTRPFMVRYSKGLQHRICWESGPVAPGGVLPSGSGHVLVLWFRGG